jgi:peptidoglycan/LPS O-acetylase OafA/YrhL
MHSIGSDLGSIVTRALDYRADIDGMRAIAVLLVVFYHAGFETFSGGFIGVDIFFVISGYLITGIVADELSAGTFRFARFYTRRIKRLLPAFYLLAVVTSVSACFVLLPSELEGYAESLLSSLFFVSNFYFGSVTEGYFAPEVELLPLLHTWSLAVEEQFYLVWPFSLLVLHRRLTPTQRRVLLGVLAAASFVAAEVAVRGLSDTVYYAPWSRAGELLIGAILGLHHREETTPFIASPRLSARLFEVAVIAVGFALIMGPAVLLDDRSPFPGSNALWPCLGIAMLIHVGRHEGALSRHILGLRPLVFVGLVSYALYLWHWPVFAFARTLRIDFDARTATVWMLMGISLALATISWWLVERPIRARSGLSFRDALLRLFAAPALVLTAFAVAVLMGNGFEARFAPDVLERIHTIEEGPGEVRGVCFQLDEVGLPPESDCLLGARGVGNPARDRGPDALLWGDSIANQYSGFFDEVGRASGLRIRDITMGGCPPLLDTVRLERRKGPICRRRNDAVMDLIRESDLDVVFIGGYWTSYLEPDGFLGDDDDMSGGRENSARVVRTGLDRTVAAILEADKQPILLRNVPHMSFDASTCKIKNAIHPAGLRQDCRMDLSLHRAQTRDFDAILSEVQAAYPALGVLSVTEVVCVEGVCRSDIDGMPLYRVGNASHLNESGSRVLGRAYLDRYGPLFGEASRGTDGCAPFAEASLVESRFEIGVLRLEQSRDGEHFRQAALEPALSALAFAAENDHVAAQSLYGRTLFGLLFSAHAPQPEERDDYVRAISYLRRAATAGDGQALHFIPGILADAEELLSTAGAPLDSLPPDWVRQAFDRADASGECHR